MTTPALSIVVPTLNAGPEFEAVLDAVARQDLDLPRELIVVDSGSTDDTVAIARTHGARLIEIAREAFNHGETRNLGLRAARGEIVVLMTQDARPADETWLRRLYDCFRDGQVAGAYSRQRPRADANPFIRHRLAAWVATSTDAQRQEVCDASEFDALDPHARLQRIAFDNVSSAVRRSVALEFPFRRLPFGEDIDWAYRVVLGGRSLLFEPRSVVVHSHNRSIWEEYVRVRQDHANLHRLVGLHTVPRRRDVLRFSLAYARELRRAVAADDSLTARDRIVWTLKALPYAFLQNLAQFQGARDAGFSEGPVDVSS